MRRYSVASLLLVALLTVAACHPSDDPAAEAREQAAIALSNDRAATTAFKERATAAVLHTMQTPGTVTFNKATVNTRTHDNWACGIVQDGREWVYAETTEYRKMVFTKDAEKFELVMGLCLNAPQLKVAGEQTGR